MHLPPVVVSAFYRVDQPNYFFSVRLIGAVRRGNLMLIIQQNKAVNMFLSNVSISILSITNGIWSDIKFSWSG